MRYPGSESFDSRALRYTDCYGQRFMKAGRYAYNALPAGADVCNDDRPHVVNVRDGEGGGEMKQSDVCLEWDGRRFVPNQPELEIAVGDLVLWHCPNAAAPAYSVVGDKAFFSSVALASECGYTHAFCHPGTYEWEDALGSKAGGTIVVTDPQVDTDTKMARWKKALAEGALVMIGDGNADPSKIEIFTGQTVYFAVVRGPVTVTDSQLITTRPRDEKPKRKPAKKKS